MRWPTSRSLDYVEMRVKHLATAERTPSVMQGAIEAQVDAKVADR